MEPKRHILKKTVFLDQQNKEVENLNLGTIQPQTVNCYL